MEKALAGAISSGPAGPAPRMMVVTVDSSNEPEPLFDLMAAVGALEDLG